MSKKKAQTNLLFLVEKLVSFYFKFSLLLQTLCSGIAFTNPILREVEIVSGYRIGNKAYFSLPPLQKEFP